MITSSHILPLAALLLAACVAPPPPAAPSAAAALAPLPELPPYPALTAPAPTAPASLAITAQPDTLQVYRATPVTLSVPGATPPCTWSFGDGTPEATGCTVTHTFLGGTADARISVTVGLPPAAHTLARILPLERLPVTSRPPGATPELPQKPTGLGNFRLAIVADTAAMTPDELTAFRDQLLAATPDLVVHLGGHADDGDGWSALRDILAESLRAHDIPLLDAVSPTDLALGAEVRRPLGPSESPLELIDGDAFPNRWAISYAGVYLLFLSGADQSPDDLTYLRTRLAEAQIYASRLVFSYVPLHPFGTHPLPGPPPHTLGPRFKVYELLLRARATALISAGHGVYYKGHYGALPVVSVGSPAPNFADRRLLGATEDEPPTLTLIDFEKSVPHRIYALGPDPSGRPLAAPLDELTLPETVEIYTQ